GQQVNDESMVSTILCGLQHSSRERRADMLPLPLIPHDKSYFSAPFVNRAKAGQTHDFEALLVLVFREERQPLDVVHGSQQSQHRIGQRWHRQKESEVPRTRAQVPIEFTYGAYFAASQRSNPKAPPVRQD